MGHSMQGRRLYFTLSECRRRVILAYQGGQFRLQPQSPMSTASSSHSEPLVLPMRSTLQYTPKKDFSTKVELDNDFFDLQKHWNALLVASELASSRRAIPMARAYEMPDLVEASSSIADYDKILLLVNHGEGGLKRKDTSGVPFLTGRGMGQALTLSRRTAMYCSVETGLCPELVVLAPLGTSIQTAMHAFPYHSPAFRNDVPWICHRDLIEEDRKFPDSYDVLSTKFPGVDFASCIDDAGEAYFPLGDMVESKHHLLDQSDRFVEWIHQRDERIILVSSHSTWLQSFCGFTVDYQPRGAGSKLFAKAEMRAVGINFE